ncbi:MAG TPA: DUF3455 domain-containing protein [Vicinamibacterales bacterium]|nr:DUF3455 domain-containing protein [Vicinamibacterales bacterium]
MTRYVLTAARVAAVGLMVMTGVGAARAEDITVPSVPGNLNVDEGNEVFLVGHGVGTQNYVCTTSATSVSGFAFSLFTPEATLFNGEGKQLITHFFSPNGDPTVKPPEAGTIRVTWEDSRDSSRVWAMLLEQSTNEQFVQKDAVAWLKLQTVGVDAGTTGSGRLTKVTFIQRLNTAGGLAPKSGCSTFEDLGRRAFVPYTADYFFYKKSHTD